MPPLSEAEKEFIEAARNQGLLDEQKIQDSLVAQKTAAEVGLAASIQEVAVRKGFLTQDQVTGILRSLSRGTKRIGGYEVIAKIGQGGMGIVYKARQISLDKIVAIKLLPPRISKDRSFLDRFLREARAAGKMNHVNIVQGIDAGEADGFHYLVMEFVEGETVREWISRVKVIPEAEALHIAIQTARALEHAHRRGIVHRDIKPDNILVTKDRVAKLADMGLARMTGGDINVTQTGVALGTPHYIAPEQARGDRDVDARADIYSLGATLYHMVTGTTPFEGSSAAVIMTKHLTEELPSPKSRNPGLSDHVCRIIERTMAKDPADRYQSATQLLKDLERVMDGKAPAARPLPPGRSVIGKAVAGNAAGKRPSTALPVAEPAPAKRPAWVIPAAVAAGILVLVVVIRGARRRESRPVVSTPTGAATTVPVAPAMPTDAGMARAFADRYARMHPEELMEQIRLYGIVASEHAGTPEAAHAGGRIGEIRKKIGEESQPVFQDIQGLITQKKFFEAGERVRDFPERLRDADRVAQLKQFQQDIRREAPGHLKNKVRDFVKARDFRNARSEVDVFRGRNLIPPDQGQDIEKWIADEEQKVAVIPGPGPDPAPRPDPGPKPPEVVKPPRTPPEPDNRKMAENIRKFLKYSSHRKEVAGLVRQFKFEEAAAKAGAPPAGTPALWAEMDRQAVEGAAKFWKELPDADLKAVVGIKVLYGKSRVSVSECRRDGMLTLQIPELGPTGTTGEHVMVLNEEAFGSVADALLARKSDRYLPLGLLAIYGNHLDTGIRLLETAKKLNPNLAPVVDGYMKLADPIRKSRLMK
ncbi:MAG: protein kinase [Planctomycetota bacterium]